MSCSAELSIKKSFITSGQEHRKHSCQPKATQVLFCSNIPFFIRLCEFVLSMDLDKQLDSLKIFSPIGNDNSRVSRRESSIWKRRAK